MKLSRLLKAGLYESKQDLFLALMTSLVIGALFLALALISEWMISSLLLGQAVFVQSALLLLSTTVAYFFLETGRQIVIHRLRIRLTIAQETLLYEHLIQLPLVTYRPHNSADLAQTSHQVSHALVSVFLNLMSVLFELMPLLLWLFTEHLLALGLVSLLSVLMLTVTYRDGWQRSKSEKRFYQVTYHIIQGIAKLRVSGAITPVFDYWNQMRQHYEQQQNRLNRRQEFFTLLLIFLPALFLMMSAKLVVWFYAARLVKCIQLMMGFMEKWAAHHDFLQKIQADNFSPSISTPPLSGTITVENVVFRYHPTAAPILEGVSLHIKAGQRVAIVGVAGSGKSTLLRLMAGIEQPEHGYIRYDGYDVKNLKDFRRQIGVVLQESRISTGNIRSNINGFTAYPIEAAWNAAKLAVVDDVIDGLAMKMHTLVDEYASILSRGQAQRIVLARALVHQPRILFLDEATQAIDDDTQRKIFQNLASYTIVMTAQRLSTIKFADVIYVLHGGRLIEHGTYTQLAEKNGFFMEMIQRQLI